MKPPRARGSKSLVDGLRGLPTCNRIAENAATVRAGAGTRARGGVRSCAPCKECGAGSWWRLTPSLAGTALLVAVVARPAARATCPTKCPRAARAGASRRWATAPRSSVQVSGVVYPDGASTCDPGFCDRGICISVCGKGPRPRLASRAGANGPAPAPDDGDSSGVLRHAERVGMRCARVWFPRARLTFFGVNRGHISKLPRVACQSGA